MTQQLINNIDEELRILKDIDENIRLVESVPGVNKKLYIQTVNSLLYNLKVINDAIPQVLSELSPNKKLPGGKAAEKTFKVDMGDNKKIAIDPKDKQKFISELEASENLIRKLKQKEIGAKEEGTEFKASRGYVKFSNRFFLKTSIKLQKKGYFENLSRELKRANMEILVESYIATAIFSSVVSIFVGIFLFFMLMFVNVGIEFPYFSLYTGPILARIFQTIWLPFVLPVATFAAIYAYPGLEKGSLSKKIERELPFATIHMSAISGSGIAPGEIFRIIGMSKEYPNLRKEIRKVLNQINLYGYDLVTALTNVAKNSPSERLNELFSGLAVTIHSGGGLKEFFTKRSETLLLSYRLEREKFTKSAETFMDIYISVVIAAPMILMLLLIMISISGLGLTFTQTQLSLIIVGAVSLINVAFLMFLHLKQPIY